MKTLGLRMAVGLVLAAGPSALTAVAQEDGFRFPNDKGGQLLGALLTPGDRQRVVTINAGRKVFAPLRGLEQPETPLLPSQAPAALLPPPRSPATPRPGHAPEETPLTSARGRPLPPQSQTLATGLLVRTASAPPDQPLRVPTLATPVPDRASLDDPTRDASLGAALMAVPPSRPGPAPFLRLGAADPFENREAVKVRTPPPELTLPVTTTPRPPKQP
jgi:hypothetical protein